MIPADCAAFYPPSRHGTKTDVEGGFSLSWALFRSRFALIYYTLRPFVILHISHSFTNTRLSWVHDVVNVIYHQCIVIKGSSICKKDIIFTWNCVLPILNSHHQCNADHLGKHWLSVLQPMSPISSFFESFELKRNVACTERKQTIKHQ